MCRSLQYTSARMRPYFSVVTFPSITISPNILSYNASLAAIAICFSRGSCDLISGVSMPASRIENLYMGSC